MKFELSPALIDDIVFGMENQASNPFFDTQLLKVVNREKDPESPELIDDSEGNFISLPEWTSRDGFKLMEDFADTVHNPLLREDLRAVLRSGRGVFRQFKDTIHKHAETEVLWYRYKEKEMKGRVYAWYNEQREYWGLETIPFELEEEPDTEELVKTDFEFRACLSYEAATLADWDKKLFYEIYSTLRPEEKDLRYMLYRKGLPLPSVDEFSPAIVAVVPSGELVGFIWAIEAAAQGLSGITRMARVVQLGVEKQFRGLGIAKMLLRTYIKEARIRNVQQVIIDVPVPAEFMKETLQRDGFTLCAATWELKI